MGLIGCTNYRYEVADASGSRKSIGKNAATHWSADPVEFSFQQSENRVAMIVTNIGKDDLTLDGPRSTIVDPSGQSRAIQSQFLPTGAHVKFILPPLRKYDPQGPRFMIGVGTGFRVEAKQTDAPIYLDVAQTGNEFWTWDGEGSIKIVLSLTDSHQQTVRRELLLRRYKD